MSKWKSMMVVAVLLVSLLLASHAQAMSSANYRLDWFTPLTGGGGGPISSTHYACNFTVGQTVVGLSTSQHYESGLGYWYGYLSELLRHYLPLMTKN